MLNLIIIYLILSVFVAIAAIYRLIKFLKSNSAGEFEYSFVEYLFAPSQVIVGACIAIYCVWNTVKEFFAT